MKLHQTCPHCERRHANAVSKLKADTTIAPAILTVALGAIPKPKDVTIERETPVGTSRVLVKYSCGHSTIVNKAALEESKGSKYTSLIHQIPAYEYQNEGIDFILESNFNCLIADEMGLGKTAQAYIAARLFLEKNGGPILVTGKATTIYQLVREFKEWASDDPLNICPIVTSKDIFFPGFKCYLVSHDLLPDVVDKIIPLGIKMVIADEVQSFKNPSSKRSKALIKLFQEGNIKHKIFLSGTPIKNRASEYFVVLNLLAPGHFPSFRQFATRWLAPNKNGVPTYIRPYALEDFRRLTARWIIRRECAEVQKDLPPLRTTTQEITITDPLIRKSYNAQLSLMANAMNSGGPMSGITLLGWLVKMRRLTALAKLPETIELVKDFLDSTESDGQKIAIGIHHKTVKDQLYYALEPYGALTLSGEDSAEQKNNIVEKFKLPENRVLIINEVSGGTGLDGLQVCNNVFTLERQWNSADEDQFIKRFLRTGQKLPVHNTILMAHGTIDTLFHNWVEEKRLICQTTYGNEYSFEQDSEGLKEFARQVIGSRL